MDYGEKKFLNSLHVYVYTLAYTWTHVYVSIYMWPFAYDDALVNDRQHVSQWSHQTITGLENSHLPNDIRAAMTL